jgi:hypothetical protein
MPSETAVKPRIDQFKSQINLTTLQQSVQSLRQELANQGQSIAQIRRNLPRGWYRKSNPTLDLEVLPQRVNSEIKTIAPLQLLKIWPR